MNRTGQAFNLRWRLKVLVDGGPQEVRIIDGWRRRTVMPVGMKHLAPERVRLNCNRFGPAAQLRNGISSL
jgi:hypothetical protein